MTLLALLLVSACATPENIEPPAFRLVDMQLLPGSLFEQRFELTLRILNPNDFDLDLDGANMKLRLNDRDFAQGVSDQRVTVPRLGEGEMRFTAATSVLDVVQQVMTMAEREDLAYEISGTAFLQGFERRAVPYSLAGELDLRQLTGGQLRLTPE